MVADAHEMAHHLLRDPREVVIDSDLFDNGNPMEQRANGFAAALLMPADGLLRQWAGVCDERDRALSRTVRWESAQART